MPEARYAGLPFPYIEALTGKEGERLRQLIPYEDPDRPVQNYRFRLVATAVSPLDASERAGTGQGHPSE